MTRNFKLDRRYIIDLLGREDFYLRCPAYFFMRQQGLASAARWQRVAATDPQISVVSDVAPAIHSFLSVTYAMWKADPSLLQPVRDFLQEKLAYPLGEVSMYYKHDEKIHSVRF